MYLATLEENVSIVLMAERGKKQIPVYFVSRTLNGAELKYPELEKLILALVGRNSIKGQILADFLAETPLIENWEAKNEEVKRKEPEPKNAWKLVIDGASSSNGSGAGLMVVIPEGKEYTYALRFEFETNNNEAEYEALLAGLYIAKEMEIRELIIFVDSQLVANQVKGIFEARQPAIKQMDDPNMTMEEYIKFEEVKARRHGRVFNWKTATYGKVRVDDDLYDLRSVESEFPTIVIDDTVTPQDALQYKFQVSIPVNDEIDFRISFDESDDEDYIIIYDINSFYYKMISVNILKTDSENDNEKAGIPSFLSPKPTNNYIDDLDFFNDFENEFPAIVYNDAQMSKSDLLTEPILNPQHIDEFNLKDETSLSKCDEEEQNVLNLNDLFSFNVIYPNDSKSNKDNDDDKVDIKHSSGELSIKPLPNVINIDVGAYAHGSNKLLETSHDTSNKFFKTETFIKELNFNIVTWNYLNKGMPFIFIIKNLYVPFGIPFDPKLFYKDEIKLGQV
ncbi:hypothetical protein Tco_1422278 [Tanacetum coccineum]